jgi:hypothetical protein
MAVRRAVGSRAGERLGPARERDQGGTKATG